MRCFSVTKKKSVHFDEEVEVQELEAADASAAAAAAGPACIDEPTIDDCLDLLQQADPTGDLRPDPPEMATLEGWWR